MENKYGDIPSSKNFLEKGKNYLEKGKIIFFTKQKKDSHRDDAKSRCESIVWFNLNYSFRLIVNNLLRE